MDELIGRIAERCGIPLEQARTAVAIMLNFLYRDGPSDLVAEFVDRMPGAREMLRPPEEAKGGWLSGLVGGLGGSMGAIAALNELTTAGLDLDQIKAVTREVVAFAKEHAGEDLVNGVIDDIPGLAQIV